MFHTFVGYLHGRLNAQNEKDQKKASKVVNKVQGIVSMMIMKKGLGNQTKVCNINVPALFQSI